MIYSCDFETEVNIDRTYIWAWALCEVGNVKNIEIGNNMESFMEYIFKLKSPTLYFHNLKFDGEFIIYWLLKNDFKLAETKDEVKEKTFTTLISDKGFFYEIDIYLTNKGKHCKKIKILDSLKVLPMSVKEIAKAFALPISKLEIDYNLQRGENHIFTKEEIDYITNDVKIVAMALEELFKQNLNKMTIGSNALNEYKILMGKKNFERTFPSPLYDSDIRQAYRGGFTYLNPKYSSLDVGQGIVLDVNSLYPSVMYYFPLPYGEGRYFEGQYKEDKLYNLYIQMLGCRFELKKDKIPTIQLKHSLAFMPTEYLTSSKDEYVVLCLSNIDLKLFFEHYDVYEIEYYSGWKFKSTVGLFKDYIDKWNSIKIEATLNKNTGLRAIAKLMLNSLYGKFATNPKVCSKLPYLEDDIVKYKTGEIENREPIYIPIGIFVTSWARYKTITSAQKVYDRFIYADTDSLHLEGNEIPSELEVSDTKLGAWKLESEFIRARFIRQKCYIEDTLSNEDKINKFLADNPDLKMLVNYSTNSIMKITCAGMPSSYYKNVTWDNFRIGNSYNGKLQINHTKGGIVFTECSHTLRE